ncbi:trehalose-phosphatase [Geobacter sp. AOG2]|uniref:trehalose-phosphatase n=1 Tax=Geobacter sp. AOG2 TaxID=1566347 RepID=UPI001CC681B0|nr:trehalose-phosphatase [Geobacter sp. AOG2]GFE60719.1 trehalose 6-phosphate phosphatase [Geobacter sp. AOG2]
MTSSYLFHSEGLAALAGYVAPDTLFAFDLDGTLAPIVDDYSAARIVEPMRTTLDKFVKLAKFCVITGRARQDALDILGVEPQLVIGNHGAEWPADSYLQNPQFRQWSSAWQDQLHERLNGINGVEIEFKGASLSIHYRKATDQANTLSLIDAAIRDLKPSPRRIGGKYVINLLPMEAFTKGEALVAAMDIFGLKRAIFFGDDVTDEEVFRLRNVDVFGIHIGEDDQTAAPYYLSKQSELTGLLNSMIGILELHRFEGESTHEE